MAERGIRLRQDLDVLLQVENAPMADDSDTDFPSAIEPDIEYNAQELRRLMPYKARDM
jgi:hypothetical protein